MGVLPLQSVRQVHLSEALPHILIESFGSLESIGAVGSYIDAKECLELLWSHGGRVLAAMIQNETSDPVHIGVLGADAVVLEADLVPDLVQQFGSVVATACGSWRG